MAGTSAGHTPDARTRATARIAGWKFGIARGGRGRMIHLAMRRWVIGLAGIGLVLGTTVAAKTVEVTIDGMQIDPTTGSPVVRLVEKIKTAGSSGRELPIWIGPFEAQAIAL